MNKKLLLEKSQKYLKMRVDDIHSEDDARIFVDDLREIIKAHNDLYYVYASPLIADVQYDQLFSLLIDIEEKFPDLVSPESPTQKLSVHITDGFTKKAHGYTILSLKNSYNASHLRERVNLMRRKMTSIEGPSETKKDEVGGNIRGKQMKKNNCKEDEMNTGVESSQISNLNSQFSFIVEPKFDGSSVHLVYKYGKFVAGITRGDGVVGEDITENMKMVRNLPLFLSGAEDIEELHLRAEVMMPKNVFETLNAYQTEEDLPLFANARNATAGTLRQLDPRVVRERGLVMFIHELIELKAISDKQQTTDGELQTGGLELIAYSYHQQQDFLKSLGLPVFDWMKKFDDIEQVIALCEDKKTKKELDAMNLDFDGLVVKVDDLSVREQLGATEHHPRRAMAYKFPAIQVATKLLDITYQIGRTGAITPVAELDSVKLSGAVISRATLHNFDYIKNLDIRRGDMVRVQRSGEVIPYILGPIIESRTGKEQPLKEPTLCPVCHTPLMRKEGEVALLCPNDQCLARVKEQLKHFVSKGCMNIDGLGEQVLDLLLETKLIKNIVDIYRLSDTQKRMQLRALPGLGSKKITQILQEIERSKSNPLRRLLHGLGIPYVGKKVATILADEIRGIKKGSQMNFPSTSDISLQGENFLGVLLSFMTNREDLLEIFGLGEQGVNALVEWFSDERNVTILRSLEQLGIQALSDNISPRPTDIPLDKGRRKSRDEFVAHPNIFAGKTIVITGIFPIKREVLSTWIEEQGGKIVNSVSSKTDFVLYGGKAGSKKKKAEELGIVCISRDEFVLKHPDVALLIPSEKKKDYIVQGGLFG